MATATNRKIKAAEFYQFALAQYGAGDFRGNILLESAPGAAKTECVRFLAEHLVPAKLGYHVIFRVIHPAVKSREDYGTYPVYDRETGKALHVAFDDLLFFTNIPKEVDGKPVLCIVLIDDVGNAPEDVQGALMQITQERAVNGIKIADNVAFIAATNRRKDRTGVRGIIASLRSRFLAFEWLMDVKTFAGYLVGKYPESDLVGFLRMAPKWIEEEVPASPDPDEPTVSCRTIERAAKIECLALPAEIKRTAMAAAVGATFMTDYLSYQKVKADLFDVSIILRDPGAAPQPVQNVGLMYALVSALVRLADDQTIVNIDRYFAGLPRPEYRRVFWSDVEATRPALLETVAYQSFMGRKA